jgi:hypothetical protein
LDNELSASFSAFELIFLLPFRLLLGSTPRVGLRPHSVDFLHPIYHICPTYSRIFSLVDYFDAETGFTAMERCTGWSAAIVTGMIARGQTPPGAAGVEVQVPVGRYVEELARRVINVAGEVVFKSSGDQ